MGKIEMINLRCLTKARLKNIQSWLTLPTCILKGYSMFKSCYVEIYLGKEEMKNNQTHNYV